MSTKRGAINENNEKSCKLQYSITHYKLNSFHLFRNEIAIDFYNFSFFIIIFFFRRNYTAIN